MNCKLCGSKAVREFLNTANFKILTCGGCTNAFTEPPPNLISYEEMDFHAQAMNTENLKLKELNDLPFQWQHSIKRQVFLLRKFLNRKASALDIGCGEGILAGELIKQGFDVTGIEPSVSASERAKLRGFDVYRGYFPHPDVKKKFDAIIMSHVLEHIEDPRQTFKQLYDSLKPEGYLLLIQTNYKGILPKRFKENWYAWVPEQHYWHFTPKGLSLIAGDYGFRKIVSEYSSLVHGPTPYDTYIKYLPFLRDQFHLLLRKHDSK